MGVDQPLYLWLLLPALALLGGFFFWAWREKRRLIARFVSARLLPSLTLGVAPERQKARMALLVAAVGLLLLALSRPQFGFSWEEARSRGLDIVVAIDTSRSMLATDVAPTRLRRAQLAALDLKRLAKADRLGLVAFAGGAYLQAPLTLDDEAFRQSVEALDVNIIPQGGTALAEAILAAKGAFKEGNDNHKVLVLFTDGEDHDGQAVETAKEAAKDGMRIFTIGVGTAKGDVLRTVDASGRMEFVKDGEGNAVSSKLNEALLQDIARETGGFYRQLAGANTMNVLYEYGLAPLPKSELASQKIKRHHERFQWLLGLAVVLLLAEMLVPERKETKKIAPAVMAKAAAFMVLLVPFAASAGPGKALKQYESGKYEASQLEYERSLKKKPDDPRLRFNAGAAAFQGKDYETAEQHLNSALVTQDVPLQQRTYYNLGNTHYRLGEDASKPDAKKSRWEQAVKSYESALKLDSGDNDSRHNLEFVKQRLEELKQQQQEQKQDDKKDKQDQKDQSKQGDKGKDDKKDEQQKQDQQKQDQQKSDQQKQDEQKKKEEEQKSADQKKQEKDKDGEEKPGQQPSPDQEKQEGEEAQDGAPTKAFKMKPEEAIRLLEALKSEEKNMPFRPILRTNRHERVFKNW